MEKKANLVLTVILCFLWTIGNSQTSTLIAFNKTGSRPHMSITPDHTKEKGIALENIRYINTKIHRHLLRHFNNPLNIIIFAQSKYTKVHCLVNGLKTIIIYTNKGCWISTHQYFLSSQVPKTIRTIISKNFPDYKIRSAIGINAQNRKLVVVNIKSPHLLKVICIENNEIEVRKVLNTL